MGLLRRRFSQRRLLPKYRFTFLLRSVRLLIGGFWHLPCRLLPHFLRTAFTHIAHRWIRTGLSIRVAFGHRLPRLLHDRRHTLLSGPRHEILHKGLQKVKRTCLARTLLRLRLCQNRQCLLQGCRQILQRLGVKQLEGQLIQERWLQGVSTLLRRQKRFQISQQRLHALTEIADLHALFRECTQLCEHARKRAQLLQGKTLALRRTAQSLFQGRT